MTIIISPAPTKWVFRGSDTRCENYASAAAARVEIRLRFAISAGPRELEPPPPKYNCEALCLIFKRK